MRSSLLLSVGAAGLAAASLNSCAANNCYRAVVASRFPSRPTSEDCSSYLAATFTLPAVTVTVTATATQLPPGSTTVIVPTTVTQVVTATSESTVVVVALVSQTTTVTLNLRAASSSNAIPAYASACSKEGQYSSACSCLGITGSPATASAGTTTITVTQTSTATSLPPSFTVSTISSHETLTTLSTVTTQATMTKTSVSTELVSSTLTLSCAGPTPTFELQAVGGSYDGDYVEMASNKGSQEIYLQMSQSSGTPFQLDSAGHLVWPNDPQDGYVLGELTSSSTTVGHIYFNTLAAITAGKYQLIQCSIDSTTLYLSCVCPGAKGNNILQQDGGYVWLGNSLLYESLTLKAICLS